ncbi:hypothetical protein [Neobacillus kokaensis]|uniref:RiboL-PSP-HEPN domain-containing protein n=1 Tax=Neobacillus kokaensis TaxID=2759023 RepID=A0ABQ3NAI9_9BACI|nr:hypothetical protein [Neobacillus kokaensis]GHI00631.1 hypothetical protein AM1BK_41730 [Neobacillus kokaensis]
MAINAEREELIVDVEEHTGPQPDGIEERALETNTTAHPQELNDLFEEIGKWESLIAVNNDLIDVAFFKIFVKFERLLLNCVVMYAIGERSSLGYQPNRRLLFSDHDHLRKTITDKKYIDVSKRVEDIVKQIFEENNPFTLFFESTDKDTLIKMQTLRNYIAHESPESKIAYMKKVLPPNSEFMNAADFLSARKNRTATISNYSYFIEVMVAQAKCFMGDSN